MKMGIILQRFFTAQRYSAHPLGKPQQRAQDPSWALTAAVSPAKVIALTSTRVSGRKVNDFMAAGRNVGTAPSRRVFCRDEQRECVDCCWPNWFGKYQRVNSEPGANAVNGTDVLQNFTTYWNARRWILEQTKSEGGGSSVIDLVLITEWRVCAISLWRSFPEENIF